MQQRDQPEVSAVRSIPACAGEPIAHQRIPACAGEPPNWRTPVYPRVCGGTRSLSLRSPRDGAGGLSPRVRGNQERVKVSPAGEPAMRRGLSPRVRGNPSAIVTINREMGVYPRVCGGTHYASLEGGR